jgi:hypothetical protein
LLQLCINARAQIITGIFIINFILQVFIWFRNLQKG